ncbi:MAG: hypothetical protein JXA36_05880 [Coriobacteriia bacterium]|nr:hypothetical protein [Coriobacteriia bacterium]
MGKAATAITIVIAALVAIFGFKPAGEALAASAHSMYTSLVAGGTDPTAAALVQLLGADAVGFILALVVSLVGGVRLPSGLLHVFFALFVPLTLATMQQSFFGLAGDVGGLADSFGTYNFIAMFAVSLAAVQIGVSIARTRFEAREGCSG